MTSTELKVHYVLGLNAKKQPIAEADDVPVECGVMVATSSGLEIVRVAPKLEWPND